MPLFNIMKPLRFIGNFMIKIEHCLECKECCSFSPFAGKKLTIKEFEDHFSFTEKLCDTFFKKIEDKYLIAPRCKQNENGKCKLYNTPEFPFACAMYPFILGVNRSGKYDLLIDRNCPNWKSVLNDKAEALKVIQQYKSWGTLDTFLEKDLRRMGYKLLTVLKNIEI